MKKIVLNYIVSDYENALINQYNKNCDLYNKSLAINEESKRYYSENQNILNELKLLDTFNEDIMFEMANFKKNDSGLSYDIWIDEAGKERENKHYKPRIKIQDPHNSRNRVSIEISKDPRVLAGKFSKKEDISDIKNFIINAYDDLMKVWNQEESAFWFMSKYKRK